MQPPAAKRLMRDVMTRGREHERQRRRRSSYDDDDQGQGSGSSHAKQGHEEEASEMSLSLPTAEKSEFSDALLARLSEIRASAPRFVDMKRLHSTDVGDDQNRLQLSGLSPISRILTDAEKARARAPDGMPVTAFDRRGQRYEMTCNLWRRDKHYRFMGPGWKSFRQAHGLMIAKDAHLTRRVTVKLWAFRSRAQLLRPEVKDDGGKKEEPGGHPDGALGLVLLLLDEGEQEEVAGEEEVEVAARGDESCATKFLDLQGAVAARGDESCATKFLDLKGAVALLLLWTRDD